MVNLQKEKKNKKLFYKKIKKKKKTCDIELLYKLAYSGIYIYIPLFNFGSIKYHVCSIYISLKYYQYCKIYTKNQYKEFKSFFIEYR